MVTTFIVTNLPEAFGLCSLVCSLSIIPEQFDE